MSTEPDPAGWTPAQLSALAEQPEMMIRGDRADGTPGAAVPVWVVCAGGQVYVRTWRRRTTGWFGQAVRSGRARVRVGEADVQVTVDDVGTQDAAGVDAAYRAKYGHPGDASTSGMTTPAARASTLCLVPVR